MKRLLSAGIIIGMGLGPNAAYAKVDLPPNVTTKSYGGGSNKAIDTIDFSFPTEKAVAFSRIKMCVAENLTNDEVRLSDSAGSFVGRTGTYYQARNGSTVPGGDIFKYVDDASNALVAHGSISRQGGLGGIIALSIRFDLEVSVEPAGIKMKVLHIEEAMKDTGAASNDGYRPIGVWTGSMYKKDIVALDDLAEKLKACVSN